MIWPDTNSPEFDGPRGDSIRQLILENRNRIGITVMFPQVSDDHHLSFGRRTMNICSRWAMAPYVGDPFIYKWLVASDNEGRYIATPVEIQHFDDTRF